MERVSDTVTPQPVSAVVSMLDVALGDLLAPARAEPADRLVVVCADVRDPGNLGSVLRSAAGAGASGLVWCEGTADPYNPKAVRASAGALFRLPMARAADPGEALEALRAAGFRLLASAARGGVDYRQADLSGDVALLLGNEAAGLPAETLAQVDGVLTVPMAAGVESLNVAMAATLLCYEVARRGRSGRLGSGQAGRQPASPGATPSP